MKTLIITICLCALLFTGQPAQAMDSTALFNTSVLGTNIQKSISEIPVGTVIVWPAGSNPTDPENWLECDGRAVSQATYPELYTVVGSRTPNYYNQFLRGGPTSQVGQTATDSTRSHNHTQPAHTHTFSGQLASTAITGTAAGQKYYDEGVYWEQRFNYVTSGSDAQQYSHITSVAQQRTAQSSAVTGNLVNSRVNGAIGAGGGDPTNYTGGTETAPMHTRVRYLIRALP